MNIVAATQKLTELNQFDKKAVQTFRQKLDETDPLTERDWLIEQL